MVETFDVGLTPFACDRTVRVYLPPGATRARRRFPALYMLDGHNLFDDADATFGRAWRLGAYLDAHGPEIVVVGVDAARDERRIDEYTPWPITDAMREQTASAAVGGGGQALVDWLVEELKPTIDARYPTDPDATALAGASLGGLMAIYGAGAYPAVFRRAAALSAAVVANEAELAAYLRDRDLTALERLYLDVGTAEWPDPEENAEYRRACIAIAELLRPRVARFRFDVVDGGEHHEAAWGSRLHTVLGFLYGP